MASVYKKQSGFTLLEILISLVLIGLLVGSLTTLYKNENRAEKNKETIDTVKKAKEVLQTFLLINGYLPCPDRFSSGNGDENRNANGTCEIRKGFFPSNTLGFDAEDGWGNKFYYQINARAENPVYIRDLCQPASVFADSGIRTKLGTSGMCTDTRQFYCSGCTAACPTLCNFAASGDPRGTDSAPYFYFSGYPFGADKAGSKNLSITDSNGSILNETTVAVVISFGSNGAKTWGGILNEPLNNCPNYLSVDEIISSDEAENCNGDELFVASGGKYSNSAKIDDHIAWIDLYEIKRMVANKRLFP